MESCGMNCIKYTLFIFNLIFAISGMGIIIAGSLVLANVGDFYNFMESRMLAPPVVLIVTGTIVFLIAFLGCFGAIRESYNMLIAFAVGLLIIFILELAAGIAAACYNNDFQDGLKTALRNSFNKYENADTDKQAWDNIQTKFMCCGVDGPQDWAAEKTPNSCCHEKQEFPETKSLACEQLDMKNYLSSVGCYDRIKMEVQSNAKCLIGVGIGIAFIEVVGIILACWLAITVRRGGK